MELKTQPGLSQSQTLCGSSSRNTTLDIINHFIHSEHYEPEQQTYIKCLICDSFTTIAESREICILSPLKLCELLSSDQLRTTSELEVFQAAVKWLNWDLGARKKYCLLVLKCVRFTLISPINLYMTVYEPHKATIFPTIKCVELVLNALSYHALKSGQTDQPKKSIGENVPQATKIPSVLHKSSLSTGGGALQGGAIHQSAGNQPNKGFSGTDNLLEKVLTSKMLETEPTTLTNLTGVLGVATNTTTLIKRDADRKPQIFIPVMTANQTGPTIERENLMRNEIIFEGLPVDHKTGIPFSATVPMLAMRPQLTLHNKWSTIANKNVGIWCRVDNQPTNLETLPAESVYTNSSLIQTAVRGATARNPLFVADITYRNTNNGTSINRCDYHKATATLLGNEALQYLSKIMF